jgi:hypothetical protein
VFQNEASDSYVKLIIITVANRQLGNEDVGDVEALVVEVAPLRVEVVPIPDCTIPTWPVSGLN